LLDEPTSALDGETGAAVIAALANLTRGKTVLHVSHRPDSLIGCGRILRMEGGQLRDQ
jgi:ABC-type bacteriocin/lantibiotic exporter with double-glycine peptidase domain